ncbi:HNH endonuclease signature motif containing protein [Phytohabitans aurantiacus]|uniref:HNH endonuclease n=2 Tax=Phytohabitans aurantiacus TaxID=3016789 RepID=A0ABQ5QSK7_9ACTN|nr:HNH endonuclease signature motif containing protein [Phytohabitans aurantiacus]GLH96285.1 HNH endonuclease [Phytohabitans aurantiacus]
MREALEQLREIAGQCAGAPVWSLPDADLVCAVRAVHDAEQMLAAVKLHLVREIDGRSLPIAQEAASTAVWLRARLQVSINTARRMVDLARVLDERPVLDAALSSAAVNVEQAQVVAKAVHDLAGEVSPDVVDLAEKTLIAEHADQEPAVLRKLADRILAYVAPEVAEDADRRTAERDEKRAEQTRAFTLTNNGDGRFRVTGWLDAEAAAIVDAALDPLCKPDLDRTPAQRRADALVEICRLALRTEQLPDNGGDRPQIALTVPYDVVRKQLSHGQLDTGERLTAQQVRRLACDARILPVVLGGDGQILDVGQSRRLFTGPLRRALVVRDGGCAFPGCDRPPQWCDAHHIRHWADGGPTSLGNGVLLCGHHHRLNHRGEWQVRMAGDGRPEFIPPAYVDSERKPRRNVYHRRT